MKALTIQEYSQVKHLEDVFETVIKSDYLKNISSKDKLLVYDLYKKYFKKLISRSCSSCVIKCFKQIGAMYFERKKMFGNRKKKDEEKTDNPDTTQETGKQDVTAEN
jgi:hypothetical protein